MPIADFSGQEPSIRPEAPRTHTPSPPPPTQPLPDPPQPPRSAAEPAAYPDPRHGPRTRADACPGALQVHEAADGALARVRVPGGAISAAQLRELAACATELGSGVIELTSRANVQVRGLRSPDAFAARIAAAGLLPSAAHERVRNIVASPFGGRGPGGVLDPQPLVDALDRALCADPHLAALPGRFLFAVDDGTGDVSGLGADVTYVPGHGLLLAGADGTLPADARTAPTLMTAAAAAFLTERTQDGRAAWRLAELPDGATRLAARLGLPLTDQPPPGSGTGVRRGGVVRQGDKRVALEVLVPLGRLDGAQALAIADVADTGALVRLTPWRSVVLLDLDPGAAEDAARALGEAGLVTDPASPWAGVSACTGRPGCAKSLADVREDARRWVATLDAPPPTPVHWSGCERRCGLPRGQVTQIVATRDGYTVTGERHTTTAAHPQPPAPGDPHTLATSDERAAATSGGHQERHS
ncbi:precorrin-3B synthase [Nonomuraea maritima]|uniref:precorrin-3B synthase n=1 Tax=Nonomuraea maritima TaxID=683260 RepID=UPI0024801909|nr:precorrin-3B synthase [Nonomuraea maritima]